MAWPPCAAVTDAGVHSATATGRLVSRPVACLTSMSFRSVDGVGFALGQSFTLSQVVHFGEYPTLLNTWM